MTFLESVWSHLSFTLVFASATFAVLHLGDQLVANLRLPRLWFWSSQDSESRQTWHRRCVVTLIVFASGLSIVQVDDVDMSGHLLAYTGELSFATLFVLSTIVYNNLAIGRYFFDRRQLQVFQGWWVLGGLAIYLTTLSGRGPDLYALGYEESLAWVALAISVIAATFQRWLVASLVLGVILSWHLRVSGSVNLLDYAIDPFIFAVATVQSLGRLFRSFARGGTKRMQGLKLETESVVSDAA